jgi:hypothetical protein
MGWKAKVIALLFGLAFIGLGAWPLGILCFLYLFAAVRSRRPKQSDQMTGTNHRLSLRSVAATLLFLLGGAALASGGVLSPVAFFGAGAVALLWPSIVSRPCLRELVPVADSILLRSKYLPFFWCAVAELKPGAEQYPMAASSFSGTLLICTDAGRTYCIASIRALRRREAEQKAVADLRSCVPTGRPGAYLLPLDSAAAAEVLRVRLSPLKLLSGDLAKSAAGLSGILLVESGRGIVSRASAFRVEGPSAAPSLPDRPKRLDVPPLTWEVFESVGKRTRWPDPDRFSDLLDSMLATKGVPLAERVNQLESSGDLLKVRSLSGEEVPTTRQQFRAIISIYS